MLIEFKLRQLSEGVETADIAEVLVAEGDTISAGQVVMEVETEKAVADMDCPHAGRVAKIHVKEGDTVPIGAVLLTIEAAVAAGTSVAPPVERRAEEPVPAQPHAAAGVSRTEPGTATARTHVASVGETPPTFVPGDGRQRPPVPAGPATRRLARQLGVDLQRVSPSGRGGRITADDVKSYVRSQMTQRTGPASVVVTEPPLPDFSQFGPIERQSLNKIAKAAAANLSVAWQTVPHVTNHDLADITELEAARKHYLETDGKSGPKITMTAIVIKAAAALLKEFPRFNASLDTSTHELILKHYYHLGCAVDTPHGLLVPVLRNVDQKTIVEVASELAELAQRARDRKLDLGQVQGASFTITNLGGIGGTAFTPIVNYPEVAILGLSRSRTELRLTGGQLEERLLMPLSLSYDHRVINGADAARFLARLCAMLGDAFLLLVEA